MKMSPGQNSVKKPVILKGTDASPGQREQPTGTFNRSVTLEPFGAFGMKKNKHASFIWIIFHFYTVCIESVHLLSRYRPVTYVPMQLQIAPKLHKTSVIWLK